MSSSRSTTSLLRATALLRVLLAFAVLILALPRFECGCASTTPTPATTVAKSCACEHEVGATCCCCDAAAASAPPDDGEPGLTGARCESGAKLASGHALTTPSCPHALAALDLAIATTSADAVACPVVRATPARALAAKAASPNIAPNRRL